MTVTDPGNGASPPALFRAEAVADLDAQTRLETRLRVVSPLRWLVLVVVALLAVAAAVWAFVGRAPITVQGSGALLPPSGLVQVVAGVSGVVTEVPQVGGDHPDTAPTDVSADQALLRLRTADGAIVDVATPVAGELIGRSPLAVGSPIDAGEVVGQVLPQHAGPTALLFVDQNAAATITPGMPVRLNPDTAPAGAYGDLVGTVVGVDVLPLDPVDFQQLAGDNSELAAAMAVDGAYRVVVALTPADTPSGYEWSSRTGPPFAITPGTVLSGVVVIGEKAPIDTLLGR